jgi:hypothetical protein
MTKSASGGLCTGPLARGRWLGRRAIWRSMPDLGPSFEQFADGLKQESEGAGRLASIGHG